MNNQKTKCVVWDLDNTIWNGILSESEDVTLIDGILGILKELDNRGILLSIASKNDEISARKKMVELGIYQYFLYPQIGWNSKSDSIETIRSLLNIGIDSFAFIDDQEYERDEVAHAFPQVLCIDALHINELLQMDELHPKFITEDSAKRRLMYQNDIKRNKIEESFVGPKEEFLALLNMKMTISQAKPEDLKRVEELTIRTHQLNSTGYTYSYEELEEVIKSNDQLLLIAGLEDKYGTYGKIGLALIKCEKNIWTIKLLLMSCRVISRGVGTILLNYIMKLAKHNKVSLQAEFVPTSHNKMMNITYVFSGFKKVKNNEDIHLLQNDLNHIQEYPSYIEVTVENDVIKVDAYAK